MAALNSQQDNCGLLDQSIPQWKRELILKRRAQGRTVQQTSSDSGPGSGCVKPSSSSHPTTTASSSAAVVKLETAGASSQSSAGASSGIRSGGGSSSSVVSPFRTSSLDRNESDFHPDSSSLPGAVTNMRFVDRRLEGGNDLVSGVKLSTKVMLDSVKQENCALKLISRMGEEKSIIIKPTLNSKSLVDKYNMKRKHHKPVVSVGDNDITSTNGKDEECLSDSSEELQYGPGIVNKLKTKYLSMTLRENQKRGVRPSLSNLRRAASLENMLDEDSKSPQIPTVACKSIPSSGINKSDDKANNYNKTTTTVSYPYNHKIYTQRRGLESMKRACSMDTLLRSDPKPSLSQSYTSRLSKNNYEKDLLNGSKNKISIANEDIIIVENSSSGTNGKLNDDSKSSNSKILNIEDKELPPPDVVKQTLKKFENTPNTRTKTFTINSSKNKSVQNHISKPYRTSSTPTNNKSANSIDKNKVNKPVLSPKPILSPQKSFTTNRPKVPSPKRINTIKKVEDKAECTNSKATGSTVETKEVITENAKPMSFCDKKPPVSKISAPNILSVASTTTNSESVINASTPVTAKATSPVISPVSNRAPDLIPASSVKKLCDSPTKSHDEEDTEVAQDILISKQISESALENIRKGGTSVKFNFKSDENGAGECNSKSHLPGVKDHLQATNTSLLTDQTSPNNQLTSLPVDKSPRVSAPLVKNEAPSVQMRQVGVIRPILTTKLHQSPHPGKASSPSTLTDLEIEKNLINRVKSIEQPVSKVVVAIKNLPDAVVVGSVPADLMSNKNMALARVAGSGSGETKSQGLWDKKPWHQNQNTMIFNFSDRKDVPDYIENDGLILRGKRERPRPGESGIIVLDDAASSNQESSTDTEDDWVALRGPPSPCDISFENDNVLINGKSNLRKHPKQHKMRIQFNDEPTTFEYPSEASFSELASTSTVDGGSSSSSTPSQSTAPSHSQQPPPVPPHAAPMPPVSGMPAAPLGGSGLASYTPSKLGEAEGWQPGVTRHTPASTMSPTHNAPKTPTSPSGEEDDYLKPATAEETVTWSEGKTIADLLF